MQYNFPKMRGEGSKAVWNFSENSSALEATPVPNWLTISLKLKIYVTFQLVAMSKQYICRIQLFARPILRPDKTIPNSTKYHKYPSKWTISAKWKCLWLWQNKFRYFDEMCFEKTGAFDVVESFELNGEKFEVHRLRC